jgi:hypothetical protein
LGFSKSIQGKLFERQKKEKLAIQSYNQAFQILGKYPNQTNPFQNEVSILTINNIESIHRNLLNLIPINSQNPSREKVRLSLKKHLLAELDNLMKYKKWTEADYKNWQFMLFIANKEKHEFFDLEDIKNFPCSELKKLDELWVKHSKGLYGFSVRKKIYLATGNSLEVDWETGRIVNWSQEAYEKLGDRVGWRAGGNWLTLQESYKYAELRGHYPKITNVVQIGDDLEFGPLFLTSFLAETCRL